ncbi:ComF family protein [Desulfosarcina sp.]|uniref:ComF family protein n=1 Tax=Desulfosarcina sp. TaxID=2027861 RepID=UPI0035682DC1
MLGRARLAGVVKRLLHDMGDALFPVKCLGCGRLFQHEAATPPTTRSAKFSAAMAAHFCLSCRDRWTEVASPLCCRCGLVFKSREGDDHLCGRCLERPGAFTRARAAGIYDDTLKTAIHALKFKGKVSLAEPLGSLLLDTFRCYWTAGDIDVVAPVPLHRRRFRRRGFNQAYLLVKGWALPDKTVVIRDLLVRTRATDAQTGLDRQQRRINIRNAFAMSRRGQSSGKRVLLVDDVLTTGATAEACTDALIRDGARRVDVLTLARAL